MKNVEKLATLFKAEPDVVKAALDEESGEKLNGILEKFTSETSMFTGDELSKKLENYANEYIEKLVEDKKPIPKSIYNHVKGNAFEAFEKARAKKYGIEEWSGLDDLEDKILSAELIKSGKDNHGEEDAKEIQRLKDLVLKTEDEKKEAITGEAKKFADQLVNRDVNAAVRGVNIDAEGEQLKNMTRVLATMFRDTYVFEFKDDHTVAKNKETGDILTNKVGDPLPLDEVIAGFAPKWVKVKDVPEGGRGGGATVTKTQGLKGIKTKGDFMEYCEKNKITPGSKEMFDAMVKVKSENPELILD